MLGARLHWLLTGVLADEDLIIDYLLHCAVNEQRAPGTLKLRLAAVRSIHVTLGLPDPLEGRNRVAMALAGLRRRYKTPVRRAPVTPRILRLAGGTSPRPCFGPGGSYPLGCLVPGVLLFAQGLRIFTLGVHPIFPSIKGKISTPFQQRGAMRPPQTRGSR